MDAVDLDALPPMDVAGRLRRLRTRLAASGCDALVVSRLTNIRYLTGFTGSAAVLVVHPDGAVLLTDGRYAEQAPRQLSLADVAAEVTITPDALAAMPEALGGAPRVGLEAEDVSWAQLERLRARLPAGELVATDGLVEELRLVKDEGEVARIEVAAGIADAALAEVRPMLAARPTEAEVAFALDTGMRRRGATGSSFETIVASGPNGALPHARPSNRRIGPGDLVVVDFGALVDGYCSDMTRTFAVGEVGPTGRRMLEVVLAAHEAGVAAVRPGAEARAVDAACRGVVADAGWADAFVHGTGHGVGLDIHERPRVAATADATLAAGNVVTVEPGVYLPAHGGVRIEDTVVVTSDGCRRLTAAPKDPHV